MSRSKKASGSGKTDARKNRLVEAIRFWALKELDLKESSIPGPEELKLLLRDVHSVPMWDHLVTCIRSPVNADLARKNLHLHLGYHGNKDAELHVQKLELGRELNSLELAVSQMEMEVSRLQTDIGALAMENESLRRGAIEFSRRSTLLSARHIKSQERVHLLREYTRRISQRKDCFCWPDQETSYFARPQSLQNLGGVELESACKRDVREACELVKDLLSVLSSEDSSTEDFNKEKSKVWSKVESLLSGYPPARLLSCLCEVAGEGTDSLHSATASLNLASDVAQLRCGRGQNEVRGSLEGGTLLQSVEDHLVVAQITHLRRCVECKRSQSAARLACEDLEKVKGQVEELLWKRLPSDTDQAKRDMQRTVVLQQLEESGCEAMLELLSQLCVGLESARGERRKALSTLQVKRNQVDQFARITEAKELQIRKVAKLNSAAREKLQQQRSELELYVKNNVCGHETRLLAEGAGLIGMGRIELELFSRLDLDRLMRTPGLSIPTCELSVHRHRPHQPSGSAGWEGLLQALQLPLHTSPHALLTHVLSSLDKVESLSKEISQQKCSILKMKQTAALSDGSQGVLQASRDYDNQLLTEGMETANKNLLLTSEALARCSVVQNTMQEWWEEPSQHCVPWVTQDGMGLNRWLEQWKVLTAKLQQLSSSR